LLSSFPAFSLELFAQRFLFAFAQLDKRFEVQEQASLLVDFFENFDSPARGIVQVEHFRHFRGR
jgi:hypothetical protein